MNCKKCGIELTNDSEYCEKCAIEATQQAKARKKSFWGELEKNQTTIEEFGYKVKTEIRKSDNTVVYIATNDDSETVAIKKISLPFAAGDDDTDEQMHKNISEKICAEMDALSKISSESGNRFVITYYDYKLVEDADKLKYDLYIRMDYLTSIGQLYSEAKLSIKDLLSMSRDICDALEWCHKSGRIHNNLNLNNIFINDDGRYLLGDFASFANKQNETDYCMAPELFYGEKPAIESDIYGLGMVMYVLLNKGLPPFADNSSDEEIAMSVKRLKNGEIPTLPRNVNQRLSDVIQKTLSSKENRYNSVDELKKAIEFLLNSMPEDWLNQDVNEISNVDNEEQDIGTVEVEQPKAPVVKEKPTTVPTPLAPEEETLKKKNIKDFWIIGVVAIVLIALVAFGTMFLYNSGNREIYSLIESESYAVAFKEISELQGKGQNVDDLVEAYVDACMSDSEYKRVVQALPLFSEDVYNTKPEYFISLCSEIMTSGREKQAEAVFEYLYQKDNLKEKLDELIQQ